jgi:hypothetical protein
MSIAVAGRHDGLNKQTVAFDKKNEDQGRREWIRALLKKFLPLPPARAYRQKIFTLYWRN